MLGIEAGDDGGLACGERRSAFLLEAPYKWRDARGRGMRIGRPMRMHTISPTVSVVAIAHCRVQEASTPSPLGCLEHREQGSLVTGALRS